MVGSSKLVLRLLLYMEKESGGWGRLKKVEEQMWFATFLLVSASINSFTSCQLGTQNLSFADQVYFLSSSLPAPSLSIFFSSPKLQDGFLTLPLLVGGVIRRVCAEGEIANATVLLDSKYQTMFYTASHSLAGWLDMMLVPYLHADTRWTLIEIHCWGTCVEFQAAFLAVALDSLLCA